MSETGERPQTDPARSNLTEEHACHGHGTGECDGCRTGNPCPACQARNARRLAPDRQEALLRGGFSLIELLIVIGLLGALATLVLPRLTVEKEWAVDESLAPKEMMDIRRAYAAFEADCVPTKGDRELIGKYGLGILMKYDASMAPGTGGEEWSFPASFDPARGKGWRGPYLQQEDTRNVDLTGSGQTYDGVSSDAIPVILDPRHNTDASNGEERYYRVLYEPTNRYLALVYVGENGILNCGVVSGLSGGEDFNAAFEYHADATNGNEADDVVRPLSTQ